jgi:hypothetical protein
MQLIERIRKNLCANNLHFVIYATLAMVYISLAMHFPISIYTTAGHDDAWFIGNAEKILLGQWLGAFNQMTLIKGQGYSYLLALNALVGIPITLTLAVIYLAACLFFVFILRKIGLGKVTALILFALLIFQPALFPTRIIRDNIYFSFLLISLSGLLYASIYSAENYKKLLIIISGLSLGIFCITREEGVWVLPGFAMAILYFTYQNSKEKSRLRLMLVNLSIYFLAALAIPLLTAFFNYSKYGNFETNDFKNSSFANVLNILNSVDVGEEVQFLPVPQKKREAIYKVSPSFRELEPYFDGVGKRWTNPGCAIFRNTCGDYAGGWFMWALRDGAASLGYYKNPLLAAEFYERIINEINSACNNGGLKCVVNPIPFMPRLTDHAVKSIPGKIIEAIKLSVYRTSIPLTEGPSWGPINRMEAIRDFLGNPRIVSPHPAKLIASGWYYDSPDQWISLNCRSKESQEKILINRNKSPDIAEHFNDADAKFQRFSFEIHDYERCGLLFTNLENKELQLKDILPKGNMLQKGSIYFDVFQVVDLNQDNWLNLKKLLISLYSSAAFYLFAAGSALTISLLLILIYLKRYPSELAAFSICLWILYYSRIAIVVMVDITSFPAIDRLYLMPIFPLWTAASILAINAFINLINAIQRSRI